MVSVRYYLLAAELDCNTAATHRAEQYYKH
jgi:hypothetical protein